MQRTQSSLRKIGESNGRIQQIKIRIGEMAVEMLRAGALTSPEMKTLLDQIAEIQQQVASFEEEIKQKRAEVKRIKTEDKSAASEGACCRGSGNSSSPDRNATTSSFGCCPFLPAMRSARKFSMLLVSHSRGVFL